MVQAGIKLDYCNKKSSNTGHCARVALYTCELVSKGNGRTSIVHRCEEHKHTATQGKKINKDTIKPHIQLEKLNSINEELKQYIGKEVISTFHRNKHSFTGKYLKNNGAIMCQDSKGKWVLVYYHQIQNASPPPS